MDALAMLREDHRKVRELFRQFEEAQDKATKKAAAETALVELNIHSVLEEEIFYPAVRRQGNGTSEIVERAEQEHHTADQLMDELMKMEAGNAEFDAKFHVLIENVKKHIEEEEAEMLPIAAEVGMARLERLGQQMEQRKQTLLREGNGRAPSKRRATTSGTRARRTSTRSGTRRSSTTSSARRTSASGTRRTSASGTRRTTASGTRRKTGSGTRRKTTASGTRLTTASGTRRKTTASGARRTTASGTRTRASTARAKSPSRTASRAKATASRAKTTGSRAAKTTASRAKSTVKRTVKQAGTRTRTTK